MLRSRYLLLVSFRAFGKSLVSLETMFGNPFETRLPTISSAVLLVIL